VPPLETVKVYCPFEDKITPVEDTTPATHGEEELLLLDAEFNSVELNCVQLHQGSSSTIIYYSII
jgi:hypothetical protein